MFVGRKPYVILQIFDKAKPFARGCSWSLFLDGYAAEAAIFSPIPVSNH
jgi:hypothetical protein